MTAPLMLNTELMTESTESLLAISFLKTNSYKYLPAVELAKRAKKYREDQVGKTLLHYAVFGKSREEAALALCLVDHTRQWPATEIYGGGQLIQNKQNVKSVLECYLAGMACSDSVAHCCYVYGDGHSPGAKVLIPCNLVRLWFKFNPYHPSTGAAQLEACAISRGVNWCPLFDPQNFKQLPGSITPR